MAKIKFQVEPDAFDQTGFSEPAKPGTYLHQVKEINAGFSKGDDGQEDKTRPRLEIIYENIDPKAATMGNDGGSALGSRVWDYITFGSQSQWKYAQFLSAFGLGSKQKPKGEFDSAKLAEKVTDIVSGKKVTKETGHPGAKCKLRLTAGRDQDGGYKAKVGSILPLTGDENVESDGFAGEEEEVVDDEAMAEESAEEGYSEDDLKALSVADLKEVVKAFREAGHDINISGKKKSEVITMILEAQASVEGVEEEEMIEDEEIIEDEEAATGYSDDDLKAMTVADLKEVAKNLNVSFGGKKKSEVIAAILEAQSGGETAAAGGDDDLPF